MSEEISFTNGDVSPKGESANIVKHDEKNNMICDDCKCGFRREEKEIARLKEGQYFRCPYCGGFKTRRMK